MWRGGTRLVPCTGFRLFPLAVPREQAAAQFQHPALGRLLKPSSASGQDRSYALSTVNNQPPAVYRGVPWIVHDLNALFGGHVSATAADHHVTK